MNIIYVSSTCSPEKYSEYVEKKGFRVSQQAQKYNYLLIEGFAEVGTEVEVISSRPISRAVDSCFWYKGEKEVSRGVRFLYLPFINYPVLRQFFVFLGTFLRLLFSPKAKETVVVCDALNITSTCATLLASFLRRLPTVGIVTDVPCFFSNMENIPFYQKVNLFLMRKFKSYLLLTEPMADIVNPRRKPYIVMEGHSDLKMKEATNTLKDKYPVKTCLYAGSLERIYGIADLVKGFVDANIPNTELHVYGSGDFEDELRELVKQYDNVKFFGVAPNKDIVEAELKATLLINPRPTQPEYTKYSFPSKNMEYMASGTPVLTTRLPGMPSDHFPYVFFIDEETPDGITSALQTVFSYSDEELFAFGARAKDFVMKKKNNCAQAQKIVEFLKKQFWSGGEEACSKRG